MKKEDQYLEAMNETVVLETSSSDEGDHTDNKDWQ